MKYSQIPEAIYVPVSLDEVMVKGSGLEGFSLMVEDPSERGLAMALVEAVRYGADAKSVHQEISESISVTLEEVESFLEDLVSSGALLKDSSSDGNAAWTAFVRYGAIPSPENLRPVDLYATANSSLADEIYSSLQSLGIGCTLQVGLDELCLERPRNEVSEKEEVKVPKVVISTGAGRAALMRFNEKAVAAGLSVLYLRQYGVEYSVGPFVVPNSCACYWEYERQWARSSASESQYELLEQSKLEAKSPLPLVGRKSAVAASFPWLMELSIRGTSSLAGEVIRGRSTTAQVEKHSIMRLPRCPVCLPLAPLIRTPMY